MMVSLRLYRPSTVAAVCWVRAVLERRITYGPRPGFIMTAERSLAEGVEESVRWLNRCPGGMTLERGALFGGFYVEKALRPRPLQR
jgi:hypothetical protein